MLDKVLISILQNVYAIAFLTMPIWAFALALFMLPRELMHEHRERRAVMKEHGL